MTLGMSFTSVPFEKASKEDLEAMKKRRNADKTFKKFIKISYQPKRHIITVSCIRKNHDVLVSYLGTKDFP